MLFTSARREFCPCESKKAAEAAFLLGTLILLESRFDYALKLKLRDNHAYVSVCQLN